MNPADYLELMQMTSDGTGGHSMNAVAILFSYIVAAHYAGSALSRFQAHSLTLIYSLFLAFPLMSVANGFVRMRTLRLEFLREYPEVAQRHGIDDGDVLGLGGPIIIVMFVLAWSLSLAFMYGARNKPKRG